MCLTNRNFGCTIYWEFNWGTGESFDALYNSDINDVACIGLNCSKRISGAGLEIRRGDETTGPQPPRVQHVLQWRA